MVSDLQEFAGNDAEAALLGKVADLKRELKVAKKTIDGAVEDRAELERMLELATLIRDAETTPPRWLTPKKPRRGHHATACLLVTDTHFDEWVKPEQVDGLNAYTREIAEMRLKECFENAVKMAEHYLSGITYDGAVLFLGGDIFSGIIHEELKETNTATLFESVLYWIDPLLAGINMLTETFGKVHVAAVVGNHGRMTRKPRAKHRAQDNIEWLLYSLMARDLRPVEGVTFQVSDSADAMVDVYDTTYLLTHGDQFRGGSGIAGALSPLMLGSHRKTRRQLAAGRPYDIMVMGHWHQYMSLPGKGILAGGSLKGFDEFAYVSNFEPEPPTQAFWLTTPEHGVTVSAPVFVQDREAEGW